MEAYTGFAKVYDVFMDNVPYKDWTQYLSQLLKEYGVEDGIVLDLGCGTGKVTRELRDMGYDMIGIDYSEEMLEIAREYEYDNFNEEEESKSILYLMQDMREFELFGTVSGAVSICDSMNYITSEEELLSVFQLVNNYLDPNGVFIFDMNTEYKYKQLLADNTIAENRENCSFIWENHYDEESQINEYNVSIFVKQEEDMEEEEDGELFLRFQEVHYQKAYSIKKVIELLEKAGLEYVAVYDAFTKNPPSETSERVYFIAKEKYQENKKYQQ